MRREGEARFGVAESSPGAGGAGVQTILKSAALKTALSGSVT